MFPSYHRLYINDRYPLYLVKCLLLHAGGRELTGRVDWHSSGRNHLRIRGRGPVARVRGLRFYYPDGVPFTAMTEEEMGGPPTAADVGQEPLDFWPGDA